MRDDGHDIAAGTGGIQIDPMLIRRQFSVAAEKLP